MSSLNLIFPHQLFEQAPCLDNDFPVYLVEEWLFFKQYPFHQQKIAFHRASMKCYENYLQEKGKTVHYISATEKEADIRELLKALGKKGVTEIHFCDPTDNWLERRIRQSAEQAQIKIQLYQSPLFFSSREDLQHFFKPTKKKFFQTTFYIQQRKKLEILLEGTDSPVGGKWSYDADNRKKYPKGKTPPVVRFPKDNDYYEEAKKYVAQHFSDHLGSLEKFPLYPIDFAATRQWLQAFLTERFLEFGPYEDAIVAEQLILNHSLLTPMLNVGLIRPQEVIETALNFAAEHSVPLNSTEGFVRQIIGWREFIRGIYECKGSEERTRNYWQFKRKIPASFYDGTTGINPLDQTIKKVLQTGYCHHIERLMILGNFMLLCEFDPDEVYRWFMELFIDAYDWVMVPNVYGMSQFADGGLMSTKPYISGSNYLSKMSNYKKGPWCDTWDALFWRFMNVHRDFFSKNPRLRMLVSSFDRMAEEKQERLMETADAYLQSLDL